MKKLKIVAAFLLILALTAACGGTAEPSPSPDPSPAQSPDPTPEPSPDPTPDPSPDPTPDPTPEDDGYANPGGAVFDMSAVDISGIDPDKPVIALTFDDGPSSVTAAMLDRLEQYGVVGTFFIQGNQISAASEVHMFRAFEMGCEFGNHSWSHGYMDKMEAGGIADEIRSTSDMIEEMLGVRPYFFRPPYIAVNDTMREVIDMAFVAGTMCNDWSATTAEQRAEMLLNGAKDGQVLLVHDGPSFTLNPEVLDIIIPELLNQGYQFVTMSQLFAVKGIEPVTNGKANYSNVNDRVTSIR